jgi:hypothetical protein
MSAFLEVAPLQWARLKDMDDVEPINDSDLTCLAEVREVLKKHGKRERFGVALLHKHFDIAPDEVLVESTDKEGRVLTIKPEKQEAAGNTVGTVWQLLDGEFELMMACRFKCRRNDIGGHSNVHRPSGD